jgi:hypothetical protein
MSIDVTNHRKVVGSADECVAGKKNLAVGLYGDCGAQVITIADGCDHLADRRLGAVREDQLG